MHYVFSIQFKLHLPIYKTCIYINIIKAHKTCYAHSPSITPKISSRVLINKYEQFNLNYSTKYIISQKYFMNTIHVNSKTLVLLFTTNHPTSIPLCEPEIYGHFRPHAHHNIIYCINYDLRCPNSPHPSRTVHNGPKDFSHFCSKFWNRSNGRSRPQTNSIINKTLKQSVTLSRIKPLPHGVCLNSKKPVPMRSPRCVEPFCFLARRIPKVGSPGILERSHSLSH